MWDISITKSNKTAYHSVEKIHTQSKAPCVGIGMNGIECEKEQEPHPQSS